MQTYCVLRICRDTHASWKRYYQRSRRTTGVGHVGVGFAYVLCGTLKLDITECTLAAFTATALCPSVHLLQNGVLS